MKTGFSLLLLFAFIQSSVQADVMVVRQTKVDGMTAFGSNAKQTKTWISGAKHREQDVTDKKASSFLSKMAADDRAKITRLDKKLIWMVNEPRKTYQEISLIPKETGATKEHPTASGSDDSSAPEEKPTMRISKAEFKVQPGGHSQTINGYACQDYTITTLLETEDLETKEKSEMKMVTTLWTTPETGVIAKLKQEEQDYSKRWLESTGLQKIDFSMLGTAMVAGMTGTGEKELAQSLAKMPEEMKKVKGYPISTRVEWYAKNDRDATRSEAAEEKADVSAEEAAALPQDVGGAFGALAGKWASKKANQKVKEKTTPKEGAPIFSTTTEIQSIQADPLPATVFEVPAGLKKVSS